MNSFLFVTFLYRFANGLLFLTVSWNLVHSGDGGAMPLAFSAIGGFVPAVIAAPFARRLLARVDSRKLTVAGIAGLCLSALTFVPFAHIPIMMLMINFIVLSIFFLLEGAWDALLATRANCLTLQESDKLNSRQSAATQAGLMLGGLPVGILNRAGGAEASFFVAASLYVAAILIFLLPALRAPSNVSQATVSAWPKEVNAGSAEPGSLLPPWPTLAALALVWPCLTLVNMVLPLVANVQGRGTVEHAAVLDAAIGLGMGFIGVAYEKLTCLSPKLRGYTIVATALLIPLPFIVLSLLPYSLAPLAVCFFLCGVGFGMLRVDLRKQLIATQPAHRVGQIVASCNGYGFPVLAVLALFYARSWAYGPFVPLVAFTAFAAIGVLATLDNRLRFGEQRNSQRT